MTHLHWLVGHHIADAAEARIFKQLRQLVQHTISLHIFYGSRHVSNPTQGLLY